LWEKFNPVSADHLFRVLDYSIQKAILDEKNMERPLEQKSLKQVKSRSHKIKAQPHQEEEPMDISQDSNAYHD